MESIKTFILGLNPQYVGYAVFAVMLIIIGIFGVLINNMMKSEEIKNSSRALVVGSHELLLQGMRRSKIKTFNYDEVEQYINRTGLKYMTNDKMTPLMYASLKVFFAVFFMIVGLQDSLGLGILLLVLGYSLLDIVANISNKSDNDNMLDDIKNVYDTLRIQTKAGVYITQVITDCYLVVQNKRLKIAFLRLTSDIAAKNDLEEALDTFRSKFDNEYINTLVVVIKQSMKTGQASKMFEDIRAQITDIESAMMEAEKKRIQTMITVCQVLLYVAIISVSLYVAVQSLSTGLTF